MKRFLLVLVVVSVLPLLAQSPGRPFDDAPGPRMTRRAAIRVIPVERLQQEQAQRHQVLDLLHTMALTRRYIRSSDPVVQQQLDLESRLEERSARTSTTTSPIRARTALRFPCRESSTRWKDNPTAVFATVPLWRGRVRVRMSGFIHIVHTGWAVCATQASLS